jgi:hypothetical protein
MKSRWIERALLAFATLAVVATSAARNAAASPWTPAPGHGYAKLWLKWLPGFGYHDGAGETIDYGAYHEVFLNAYGELGVAEGVSIWLHAPLVQTFVLGDPRPGGETDVIVGPGDPTLGARWRFLRAGRLVGSVDVGVGVPFATSRPQAAVFASDAAHAEIAQLRIGSGVFRGQGGFSLGYGWDKIYASGSVAYVLRSGGWDDVLTWSAELGARFSRAWSGRVRASGWHPLVPGDAPRTESPSGINNGTGYLGVGLEGEWQFVPRWFLGLTLEGGLVYVRRQTGGPVISVFLATTF